jgi:N-methylhydantoinase A
LSRSFYPRLIPGLGKSPPLRPRQVSRDVQDLHEKFYGYHLGGQVIEIVTLKVTAVGATSPSLPAPAMASSSAKPWRTRPVYFQGLGFVDTPIIARNSLSGGAALCGPAIIEENDSTTLLFPEDRMTVLSNGVLSIEAANR